MQRLEGFFIPVTCVCHMEDMSVSSSADTPFSFIPSCAKLNKVMLRKGNATHDQVCLDQSPSYLTPNTLSMRFNNETNNSDLRRFEESLVTITGILLTATATENPSTTAEEKAWAGTFPTSVKWETTMEGNKDKANSLQLMKLYLWVYVQTHRSANSSLSAFS